jgi:hypothetical protein
VEGIFSLMLRWRWGLLNCSRGARVKGIFSLAWGRSGAHRTVRGATREEKAGIRSVTLGLQWGPRYCAWARREEKVGIRPVAVG